MILRKFERIPFILSRSVRVSSWPTLQNPWIEHNEESNKLSFEHNNFEKINYIACKDSFKYVLPLLPNNKIPSPPKFPTPSGWIPPDPSKYKDLPYFVQRSSNHMLPVYYDERNKKFAEQTLGIRQLTVIRNVQGDMFALSSELKEMLSGKCEMKQCIIQTDEATRTIRIDGVFLDEVAAFLLKKGF